MPRALVVQASPDMHGDYNAMMNCIFSAHRSSVPVDCCVLGLKDSSFLQQAAHITGEGITRCLADPRLAVVCTAWGCRGSLGTSL
jgi:hypothetical protein